MSAAAITPLPSLMGIRLIANPYVAKTSLKQFRFPRSKRKRILKKWQKRAHNWREVASIFRVGADFMCHPDNYEAIRKQLSISA
jgi:hypothetical protein